MGSDRIELEEVPAGFDESHSAELSRDGRKIIGSCLAVLVGGSACCWGVFALSNPETVNTSWVANAAGATAILFGLGYFKTHIWDGRNKSK